MEKQKLTEIIITINTTEKRTLENRLEIAVFFVDHYNANFGNKELCKTIERVKKRENNIMLLHKTMEVYFTGICEMVLAGAETLNEI